MRERLCVLSGLWRLLVSREAAKTRRSVFGFRSGESRTGVRGCGVSVARAFQPEICPAAIDLRTGAVELQTVCLTRSREAAKENAGGCCGVW